MCLALPRLSFALAYNDWLTSYPITRSDLRNDGIRDWRFSGGASVPALSANVYLNIVQLFPACKPRASLARSRPRRSPRQQRRPPGACPPAGREARPTTDVSAPGATRQPKPGRHRGKLPMTTSLARRALAVETHQGCRDWSAQTRAASLANHPKTFPVALPCPMIWI